MAEAPYKPQLSNEGAGTTYSIIERIDETRVYNHDDLIKHYETLILNIATGSYSRESRMYGSMILVLGVPWHRAWSEELADAREESRGRVPVPRLPALPGRRVHGSEAARALVP